MPVTYQNYFLVLIMKKFGQIHPLQPLNKTRSNLLFSQAIGVQYPTLCIHAFNHYLYSTSKHPINSVTPS
ncbi:MAG: hypothetical protein D4R55_01440 [Chitinophagaceae bacterium]|nr:MAG: hypothetical protein D4R55_01440 [Chitinophagaceae bacterium]